MLPRRQFATLLITLSLQCVLTPQVEAQETAPIMPLASKSILLDITTAGDRLLVAGERGHILYSDDDGNHWQQAAVPTTQMLTSIHFVNGQKGWAVGHDGLILVSDDGGENWRIQRDGLAVQQQANLDVRAAVQRRVEELEQSMATADEDTKARLESGLEDARMELEDADITLEEPVFTSPLMDVWFQDADRGWAVGTFGTLVATEDGGQHWVSQQTKLENPEEFHLNAVTGDSKGRVFIAGEGGVMFRSLDSGRSWESLQPFYDGSWFGVVYNAQHDTLLMFGLRGNLYRSADFGSSWEPVPGDNSTLAGGTASAQGDTVLVGAGGTVLVSADGGQSFRRTVMEDRLGLSSGLSRNGKLVLVGQGGVKTSEGAIDNE